MTVPGRRHHRRRRSARAGPVADLPRGRAALRLHVDRDRQPRRPVPDGRHPQPRAHRHPARRGRTTAAACSSTPRATCSSAPATRATPRSPPTRTRWPARSCGSTSSAARGHRARLQQRPPRRHRAVPEHRRPDFYTCHLYYSGKISASYFNWKMMLNDINLHHCNRCV